MWTYIMTVWVPTWWERCCTRERKTSFRELRQGMQNKWHWYELGLYLGENPTRDVKANDYTALQNVIQVTSGLTLSFLYCKSGCDHYSNSYYEVPNCRSTGMKSLLTEQSILWKTVSASPSVAHRLSRTPHATRLNGLAWVWLSPEALFCVPSPLFPYLPVFSTLCYLKKAENNKKKKKKILVKFEVMNQLLYSIKSKKSRGSEMYLE